MSRALRRHHRERLKMKRSNYNTLSVYNDYGEKVDAKTFSFFETPCKCSCFMCGNPRKYWNEKTLQEIKSEEHYKFEISHLGYTEF
ncbi:MAG: hypothetical protein AAGA77_13730 [Bacteroidota bacterium]